MIALTMKGLQLARAMLVGAALWTGIVSIAAASGPTSKPVNSPVSGLPDTQSIQRALHYELMLGIEMTPEITACVDARVGESWQLPTTADEKPSERFVERAQRAHEECNSLLLEKHSDVQRRYVSESFRRQFKNQILARQAHEATRQAVRGCMQQQEQSADFKRCLEQSAPGVLTELSWPRWLAIFELFLGGRAQASAEKPS